MKTYKQFLAEVTGFVGREDMVMKYNAILSKNFNPDQLRKYLNGKIKKASVDAEKLLEPGRMVKTSKSSHERFNRAGMKNPYPNYQKLQIEPMKNGMFRVQLIATANFLSASYIGSQTWYPYGVFMELIVDEDFNVKKIVSQHFTVDNAIRRSAKFRGTGPLKKVLFAAYDLIAKEAIYDLKADTKIAVDGFSD